MEHTSPRKLTIGILTYDDFDGLFFSIQSIRLHHPEVLSEIEFLILDNSPDSAHGKAVDAFTEWIKQPVGYVAIRDRQGTALRDHIFRLARTPYVLCLDSHVLLAPHSLRKLINFFDLGRDEGNLLQGPLLFDNLEEVATHFDPVWRDRMWGVWGKDARGFDAQGEPFEIPAQGLGLFACRKHAWLEFNPRFRGFGGEECYIHEKYRQAGRKTLCLPFLRWMHRFKRPAGAPYPLRIEDRVRNYLIGHAELGLDPSPVLEHFAQWVSAARLAELQQETVVVHDIPAETTTLPFWIQSEREKAATGSASPLSICPPSPLAAGARPTGIAAQSLAESPCS